MVTAILVVIGPHVTRPLRRFGWLAIVATAFASVSLGYGTPTHIIGSFGIGLFSAGLLLAIVGSPRGYPDPNSVAAALASLGAPVHSLEPAPYQTWGVIRFVGRDGDGEGVDIKVHGRDAVDSRLVAKLWHTLWYRESSTNPRLLTTPGRRARGLDHSRGGSRRGTSATIGSRGEPHVGGRPHLVQRHRHRLARIARSTSPTTSSSRHGRRWVVMQEGSLSNGSLDTSAVQVGPGWADHHRLRPRFALCR